MVTPPTTLDPATLDPATLDPAKADGAELDEARVDAGATALNDGHDEALAFVTRALDETPRRIDGVDRESMELILLLHRVTNVVVYDLESRVHRPAGWSWAAFRAVFTLWISGPLEPSRLAETSGMSRQAVSSLVKTLEADGLIARSAAEHDARSVVLTLTPLGTRKIVQVFREHNLREADWAATLDADERATMTRLLRKLASAAQQDWVSHRF